MKTIPKFILPALLFPTLWIASGHAAEAGSGAYAKLLEKVVTPDGVRWAGFGAEEKQWLSSFLDWVAQTNPVTLGEKNDQLAFWINAHNACVMKFIADRLPLESVMTIPGFRDRLKCKIAGGEYSLVELESGVLRPLFNEPSIHFVLWWGTKGGPKLRPTPYEGKDLKNVLDETTRKALANPLFVRFEKPREKPPGPTFGRSKKDEKEKVLALSLLFDWYKSDFGKKEQDLLNFIRTRLPEKEAKKIPNSLSEVSFMTFDWTLDGAK